MLNPLAQLTQEERLNLKTILESEKAVCAGQMVIVGLDALKGELGDGWSRYCDRVHGLISKIMVNVLAPSEVSLRLSDDRYVVVFRDRDQAAAKVVCKKILMEVRNTFLGAKDMQNLDIDSMILSLNPEAFAESMGLDISTPGNPQAGLANKGAGPGKAVRAIHNRQKPFEVTAQDVWYVPVWDVENRLVYNYSPTIIREAGRQKSVGYGALPDQKNLNHLRKLDLYLAATAFRDLQECQDKGVASVVTIPIHYSTMDNDAARAEFHRLCASVSPRVRNATVFVLDGLSPGRPPWRLYEFAATLGQLGKMVLAKVSRRWERLGVFADLPVKGLIVDLEQETRGDKMRLQGSLERIKAFCDSKRMKMGVSGVMDPPQGRMAQNVGVKWLSGHNVLGAVDCPQPAMDFASLAQSTVLPGARDATLSDDDLDKM